LRVKGFDALVAAAAATTTANTLYTFEKAAFLKHL
jgi:hypothetical protein